MRAYERLIKYTKFETASDDRSKTYPSTASQLEFGRALVEEMKSIGIEDANIDQYGYVTGTIPSNIATKCPVIGFIAHMDTVGDTEYKNVKTRLIENYDGSDICVDGKPYLSEANLPVLKELHGKTLLVTDGTTLLGADDKAGIAEIMTFAEKLINDPSIKHGDIRIAFTPDEEIGRGVDYFDVPAFKAEYAYTLDGSAFGEVEYETFNGATAEITIHGISTHTGTAKNKMKNAILIAGEFLCSLPEDERPETTEGYEGFYHANNVSGTVELAKIRYNLRDHDKSILDKRKQTVQELIDKLNEKYGEGTVEGNIYDTYYNMREKIEEHMHLIEIASDAVRQLGGTVMMNPVRGGTDGCKLSFMGLPCPNLGTGSYYPHGKFEFSCVEDMDKAVELMVLISKAFAER